MKACPVCGRLYPDDAGFCPIEGTQLGSVTDVPVQTAGGDQRIGQLLDSRYQVRRVVADGGMGRVYEALDLLERRNTAIKVLHPEVARDSVALERFRREYEVSNQLPHQHIVEVLGFMPTHDGSYALVMEFLYGEELRNTLRREAVLSPERGVRMLSQLAIGLDEAHARKFVHRDLKPDNVFLCQTSDGDIVKILDFGSVKDKTDKAKKLTVMGTTIGSPFYMAPEQAQGLDTLDHRADVWALAAIFYECVTGRVPFKGQNGPSILLEILTKEPMPISLAGQGQKYPVPPTLDPVMLHAFKKSATQRIPTVGALADAIGQAYGLLGNHRDWASTSQQVLADGIARCLPGLMSAQPKREGESATDAFFGAAGSLEQLVDPFAVPDASSLVARDSPPGNGSGQSGGGGPWPPAQEPRRDFSPGAEHLVIPVGSLRWVWLAVLSALGLALGIVVASILAR
jgi:serine/threonine protein kinase